MNKIESKYAACIEDNSVILCEKHKEAFKLTAVIAQVEHTIIELEDEDAEKLTCHACDLQAEMTRPRIILPGDLQ
jgi:cell division septum initiation protein DivIVA